MLKIAVLASGSGTNLQSIIDNIESGNLDAKIEVVLSDKSEAFALERARKHHIDAVSIGRKSFGSKEDYEQEVAAVLKSYHVDLVVLAGYMRIVGKTILAAFSGRVMNIHPALLPAFPGLNAQDQAFQYGVKVAGCTVHFVDEGMDTGPIILQAAVPVQSGDTVDTLRQRILEQEHRIYPQAIQLFAKGRLKVEGRKVIVRN